MAAYERMHPAGLGRAWRALTVVHRTSGLGESPAIRVDALDACTDADRSEVAHGLKTTCEEGTVRLDRLDWGWRGQKGEQEVPQKDSEGCPQG